MASNRDDMRQVRMDMQGWVLIMDLLWHTWASEELHSRRRREIDYYLTIIRGELGAPLTPENNARYNGYVRHRDNPEPPMTPGIVRR
jgi:hypothetical protein